MSNFDILLTSPSLFNRLNQRQESNCGPNDKLLK